MNFETNKNNQNHMCLGIIRTQKNDEQFECEVNRKVNYNIYLQAIYLISIIVLLIDIQKALSFINNVKTCLKIVTSLSKIVGKQQKQ